MQQIAAQGNGCMLHQNILVDTPRHQALAIATEGDGDHRAAMSKASNFRAVRRIDQPGRMIVARRRDISPIRAEDYTGVPTYLFVREFRPPHLCRPTLERLIRYRHCHWCNELRGMLEQ